VDELSLQQRYEMTQQGYEVRVAVTERNNDRHVIPAANQCSPLNYSLLISSRNLNSQLNLISDKREIKQQ